MAARARGVSAGPLNFGTAVLREYGFSSDTIKGRGVVPLRARFFSPESQGGRVRPEMSSGH
eukprot:5000412-Prymnesium_polylepis.1